MFFLHKFSPILGLYLDTFCDKKLLKQLFGKKCPSKGPKSVKISKTTWFLKFRCFLFFFWRKPLLVEKRGQKWAKNRSKRAKKDLVLKFESSGMVRGVLSFVLTTFFGPKMAYMRDRCNFNKCWWLMMPPWLIVGIRFASFRLLRHYVDRAGSVLRWLGFEGSGIFFSLKREESKLIGYRSDPSAVLFEKMIF